MCVVYKIRGSKKAKSKVAVIFGEKGTFFKKRTYCNNLALAFHFHPLSHPYSLWRTYLWLLKGSLQIYGLSATSCDQTFQAPLKCFLKSRLETLNELVVFLLNGINCLLLCRYSRFLGFLSLCAGDVISLLLLHLRLMQGVNVSRFVRRTLPQMLVFDESVDVILSAVLAHRNLENERYAEQCLLCVSICHNL